MKYSTEYDSQQVGFPLYSKKKTSRISTITSITCTLLFVHVFYRWKRNVNM